MDKEVEARFKELEEKVNKLEVSVIVRSAHGFIAEGGYNGALEKVKFYNVINYDGVVSNCFVYELDKKERLIRLDDIFEKKRFTIEIDKEAADAKFEIKEIF
ncbi:MAG: hypothetical protein IJK62_00430 [Bacteroidales bacterium]|nr:hypothetical protein [Bacteroidales bacterium]